MGLTVHAVEATQTTSLERASFFLIPSFLFQIKPKKIRSQGHLQWLLFTKLITQQGFISHATETKHQRRWSGPLNKWISLVQIRTLKNMKVRSQQNLQNKGLLTLGATTSLTKQPLFLGACPFLLSSKPCLLRSNQYIGISNLFKERISHYVIAQQFR